MKKGYKYGRQGYENQQFLSLLLHSHNYPQFNTSRYLLLNRMKNKFMSRAQLVAFCTTLAVAASLPSDNMGTGDIYLQPDAGSAFIYYDGPLYNLTSEDIDALSRADGNWTRPDSMPNIIIDEGMTLIFNGANDTSLEKRSGNRGITLYDNWTCFGNAIINNSNFGCGTGCITLNSNSVAYSEKLFQSATRRPNPTASMWYGPGCQGPYQPVGVNGVTSCTNSADCPCNGAPGWRSFIAYYDC